MIRKLNLCKTIEIFESDCLSYTLIKGFALKKVDTLETPQMVIFSYPLFEKNR